MEGHARLGVVALTDTNELMLRLYDRKKLGFYVWTTKHIR